MALTKAKKAEKVATLAKELEGSTSAIVGTFAKLTVSQDFALRGIVRGAGGKYRVLKNKLAARASQGSKIEAALQGLKGVSSVAYTSGDPVALAKALTGWVKDNAEFTFKLGIVDGKVITVEEVGQLATMPGKEEIFAKLLFLINSPAQRLATVLNATGRDLAVVLGQGVEKEKFTGAAAAPAASAAPVAAPIEASPAAPAVETHAAGVQTPIAEAPPSEPISVPESPAAEVQTPVAEAAPTEAVSAPEPPAENPEAVEVPTANEQAATEDPVEGKVVEETPVAEAPIEAAPAAEEPAS